MSISSCLTALFRRIGGLAASFSKEAGRLACTFIPKRSCVFSFAREDTGFAASATKKGGMHAVFGIVCSAGLDEYILWASDGMVLNVYGDKIYLTRKFNNG